MLHFKLKKKLLNKIFAHYNAYFELKIVPEFKIRKLNSGIRGLIICYDEAENEPARVIIKISNRIGENVTVSEIISSVVHEMIHQYQYEHNLPVEHDALFESMVEYCDTMFSLDVS